MIEDHVDPTAEAHQHITNLLRMAVTAAAAIAEKRARQRREQLAAAARQSEAERQALTGRLHAEQIVAEQVWRPALADSWWQRAEPADIASAAGAAAGWAGADPAAAAALDHIGGQLHDRYGLDLPALRRQAGQAGPDRGADIGAARLPAWHAEVLAAAGPQLGRDILDSPGWGVLDKQLTALRDGGADVETTLRSALRARELDTAKDKAGTLAWRLHPKAAGPANPPAVGRPSSPSPAAGDILRQRAAVASRDHGPGLGGPER